MTQIEQFKAELNRRIELYGNPLGVADVRLQDERKGMLKALSDMLAFIDSLPAETTSSDLEKEIRNYDSYLDERGLTVSLDAIARHFAEWQKKQDDELLSIAYFDGVQSGREAERKGMMKGQPEGLDEAAKEYARNYIGFDQWDLRDMLRVFKAGAEWDRAKMMENAVEVVVVDDWQYGKDTDGEKPAIKVRNPNLKIGDKKKIIILK